MEIISVWVILGKNAWQLKKKKWDLSNIKSAGIISMGTRHFQLRGKQKIKSIAKSEKERGWSLVLYAYFFIKVMLKC